MPNQFNTAEMAIERIGLVNHNKKNQLMKIVDYFCADHIIVEFENGYRTNTSFHNFLLGSVKNITLPTVYGWGITNGYPTKINYKYTKEYLMWRQMICRSFDNKYKSLHPTYEKVICSEEWKYLEDFVNWCHNQSNWDFLIANNITINLDKDILIKNNKLYAPDTCCLVPQNVNKLFTKSDKIRGELPIGVCYSKHNKKYYSQCKSPFSDKKKYIVKYFDNVEDAFIQYKNDKELIIRQIAQIEYQKGSITKQCYEAMMDYQVEITD